MIISSGYPLGWHRTRLRFCVDGRVNGAWGSEQGENEYDVVCVRVADFDWDHLSIDLSGPTIRSISKAQFRRLSLRPGDILLEKSGGGEKTPVGRVVQFDHSIDAITSNFVARIRPNKSQDSRFLCYLLAALYMSGYSHQFIKQNTGIQNLDDAALFSTELWIPDLATQKRIADFLDRETARIDQLIEKKQRLVELLGEKAKALTKRLVFGQHLAVDFKMTSVTWMPELPTDWLVQRLTRNFQNLDSHRIPLNSEERSDLENIFPYYGASGIIDYVDRFIFDEDLILVGEDGANLVMQSTPVAFIARGRYWVNNHAHILRPLSGPLEYWVHVLNQVPYEVYVTGSAQPKLTAEALGNIPLPIPPLSLQHQIAAEIQDNIGSIMVVKKPLTESIERLREFRSTLITAAVTGQIDVDSWSRRGGTDQRLEKIEEEMRV